MKMFVGMVNGKSFDNEKDFSKAANDAIKSNDGNLSISSYYSYVSNELPQKKENKKLPEHVKHIVEDEEYVITSSVEPKVLSNGDFEYPVSDTLNKRLLNADNKKDIEKTAQNKIFWLDKSIKNNNYHMKELQKDIENLQNDLYDTENCIKKMNARQKYYNNILDIVTPDNTPKCEDNYMENTKDVPSGVDAKVDGWISTCNDLLTFLKEIGFTKK